MCEGHVELECTYPTGFKYIQDSSIGPLINSNMEAITGDEDGIEDHFHLVFLFRIDT